MDPVVVKTVSYFKESAVNLSLASVLVMKESFLQEESKMQKAKSKRQKFRKYFIFQK